MVLAAHLRKIGHAGKGLTGRHRTAVKRGQHLGAREMLDDLGTVATGYTGTSSTMAASLAFSTGTSSPLMPRLRQASAMESAPWTGLIPPSRETSPTITSSPKTAAGMIPSAARIPTAMGRSNAAPSLRRAAGARLTVIL